jgi:glycine cleavage system H protein
MTVFLVVLMVALFLLSDWWRRRSLAAPARAATPRPLVAPVRVPRGVFFAPSHTWLSLLPSGRAWLGVDDFVVRLLEHPRARLLAPAGTAVERGDPLFALEDGEHRLTVRSPIAGRLVAVNPALARQPALPERAPLCETWAYEIQPERAADLKSLLLGEEVTRWMAEEFRRLRDVLAGADPALSPAMLQDGGPPIAGAMKHVAPEVWVRFEHEFLEVR